MGNSDQPELDGYPIKTTEEEAPELMIRLDLTEHSFRLSGSSGSVIQNEKNEWSYVDSWSSSNLSIETHRV